MERRDTVGKKVGVRRGTLGQGVLGTAQHRDTGSDDTESRFLGGGRVQR